MPKVTFYPIGNADTCLIELSNGKKLIYDYANMRDPNDQTDKRIDLKREILGAVGEGESVDVLAISHLDQDHYKGVSELFWLDHAEKYQDDDRIKIDTLWVPAALVLEEGLKDEAAVIRAEARHRLKQGEGIRVFSTPKALDDWLKKNGILPADRAHLITNAGNLAPEFTLASDGFEAFVHSPFAERDEDGGLIVRNNTALYIQAVFRVDGNDTKLQLTADTGYELFEQIVRVTKKHGNEARLEWDINNIAHHCSYLSLADEKGADKTTPVEGVRWLYEEQGRRGAILVSTSKPIPSNDDDDQPPHRQAATYYKDVAAALGGEFVVTMEHPNTSAPKPLVIQIGASGATLVKPTVAATLAASRSRPRAG